jgi:hypothetical protein
VALATYSDLLSAAANWLGRSDLTSRIPEFVTLAQARINRQVRAQAMETKSTSFSINAEYVNVPSDFIEARNFYITSTNPDRVLRYMAPEQMTHEYPSDNTDIPGYYSIIGTQFRFSPSPAATYTATLIYYAKPATLATTTQETNTLFPANADLYLYATLLEAEAFIQNDPRLPVWKQAYDEALFHINKQANASRYGGPMAARPG